MSSPGARANQRGKYAERLVARRLGFRRRGNTGQDCSDLDATCPLSVEVTRTVKGLGCLAKKAEQAKRHARLEGKPWMLWVLRPRERLEQADVLMPGGLALEMYDAWRQEREGLLNPMLLVAPSGEVRLLEEKKAA